MVTLLITSSLLLAAIIYALYRSQQTPSDHGMQADRELPSPAPGWTGLFNDAADQKQLEAAHEEERRAAERAEILARAERGERSALASASACADKTLYDEVLNILVGGADSDAKLLALVSYMTRETPPLKINRRLAERFMSAWRSAPDRGMTAKMLHVVALADDAVLYRQAVEAAHDLWQDRGIPELTAEELRSVAESEYWILSQSERSSGQGFLLKLKLAALRRATKGARRANPA